MADEDAPPMILGEYRLAAQSEDSGTRWGMKLRELFEKDFAKFDKNMRALESEWLERERARYAAQSSPSAACAPDLSGDRLEAELDRLVAWLDAGGQS